ncbi:PQQ-binding-like beta-propeller repeat protein [Herbiconiux sp. VKM Ac-1786]|uniref:outer membrane protein assembly factor BamB family protein n=1 Tax=Herbiconiux sp. VKM Ac-1786 TaxID=2783824 RepID=UPI00188A6951|nr:PQQ-binding-like beta-propeller repeat protein [Herbiconiux sp. VKM Ac-1786]MBF4573224.1 PQQ-binding-like beta-propeller repeat protein [Herbiconiux sp. VKM Ac-1786]
MTEFDPTRSDAIRSLLIETVEQTPRRDHRRHLRIAIIAVLAALGGGLGTAAVAVAVTGGVGLPDALSGPPAATAPAAPTAPATPAPPPPPTAPVPTAHPLVLSDDVIVPHDVLSAPAADPLWTLALPSWRQECDYVSVLSVADGYALIQVGPTAQPEDLSFDCDLGSVRLGLSLVDTTTGVARWNREWTWQNDQQGAHFGGDLQVKLLGTSGRVLVSSTYRDVGPQEVLDLASGATLGPVHRSAAAWASMQPLQPVGGSSSDVIEVAAAELDASGQPTGPWTVQRADPLDLSAPSWTYAVAATGLTARAPGNGSFLLELGHQDATGRRSTDVLDIDSGSVMVQDSVDRSYLHGDRFSVRESDLDSDGRPHTVAGIDPAGNELWTRSSDTALGISLAGETGVRPGSPVPIASTVLLFGDDGRIEAVDGLTGETRWVADDSACLGYGGATDGLPSREFAVDGAGVLRQQYQSGGCAFDLATGKAVDAPEVPRSTTDGALARYRLTGGFGTGGLWTYKWEQTDPSVPGSGTVYDITTGAELWSRPIAYDESWTFAGGRLVSITGTTIAGLG